MNRSEAGKLGYLKAKVSMEEQRNNKRKIAIDLFIIKNKKCKNCSTIISYERRSNSFCGHSCCALYQNKCRPKLIRLCVYCNKTISNKRGLKTRVYCGRACQKIYGWDQKKKIIKKTGGLNFNNRVIKRYLIEVSRRCSLCLIRVWKGEKVPLILDHIDGNPYNNELKNLRLVCPNCDAQLPTFAGRNRGNGRHYRRLRYKQGKSS